MTAPELAAFHVCVVVRDLEAAMETYRSLLGVDWHVRAPWANPTRMAYGRGGGQTFELVQPVGKGTSQFHEYLETHGEGIQHIGFWTPDVRGSVEAALANGAKLVSASTDADGNVAIQLLPQAGAGDLSQLGSAQWMDVGLGGWRIEYIGVDWGVPFFEQWLGPEYAQIVTPPPWG
jgi:catechol 2,3-dioxygenase-like lactoylglutathione lyase family enzyme